MSDSLASVDLVANPSENESESVVTNNSESQVNAELVVNPSKSESVVSKNNESEIVSSKNSESQANVELVANAVPFSPQATCNSRQNINDPNN